LLALNTCHVSTTWKYIPDEGDDLHQHDIKLHKYLAETIPEALAHTGSASFDDHLKGVQAVLRKWNAPDYLCNAGLFHSIYGTEGFQGYKLSVNKRPAIRNLIGAKSERLVWIFCMVDRLTVDNTVFSYKNPNTNNNNNNNNEVFQFLSREELGGFSIELDKQEWFNFIELTLADWLEQVEGAAEKVNVLYGWKVGEAWSYRREAYKKMALLLSQERNSYKYIEMYEHVYAQEPMETRTLIQYRTPPMSQAAREAREAIESILL
jgi:hypothetical protein